MTDDIFVGTPKEIVKMLRTLQADAKTHPEDYKSTGPVAKIYMVGGRVVDCDVFILNTARKEIAYHEVGKRSTLSKIPFYDVVRWEELP